MKFLKTFIKKRSQEPARRITQKLGPPDRWLVAVSLVLCVIGIVMVYNSSVAIAIRDFADQYHFVREQGRWLALGLVGLFVCARIPYKTWYALAFPMLLGTIGLLLAVFIPGLGVRALGAHRWLNLGVFILQPAEVAKLTMVMYLSAWFANKEKGRLAAFVLLLAMVVGLVVIEPDLGTATIILGTALAMYFYSGAPLVQFALLVPFMLAALAGLAVASPYRFRRLTTFFNPESDPLGASYQIRQALLALGSGGLLGVGIGKSRQKFEYLPEANTDSIFAIIGEEAGFIGATLVVVLFAFFIWRGFRVARRAPDEFGRLLALGITTFIGLQAAINMGAIVALIPLTGVTLPFISYGGSSLVITLAAVGILLNISRHRAVKVL
jgi:cell division protein FtsW